MKRLSIIVIGLLLMGCNDVVHEVTPNIAVTHINNGLMKLHSPDDGNVQMETSYKNGVKHGVCKTYYKKRLELVENYVNGKREGMAVAYFPSGVIAGEYFYDNDQKERELQFDTDGKIMKEFFYEDGNILPYKGYEYDKEGSKNEIPENMFRALSNPMPSK
jgi:antitoxin component YwqK of YwqJK toxin-antitoxin module